MHPLTYRRFKIFRANKRAFVGAVLFGVLLLLSLAAPFLANDRPLFVLYRGQVFFPVFQDVTDRVLGGDLPLLADYTDAETQQRIAQNGFMVKAPIPYRFDTVDYIHDGPFPAPPTKYHWLGTDDQGRDLLARLIYALRISLLFGLVLTFFSAILGMFVGALQGYFGGLVDLTAGRFLEIWGSLPQLFILIIVSSLIVPSFWSVLCVLLFFSWTSLTGVVRAEFLKTRQLDYVKAAKLLGVGDFKIMVRHILPNALVSSITYVPFMLSGAIVSLTALDFLGLGLPPGTPSLGELVRLGKDNLHAPWIGLTIFFVLTVLLSLLIFIGEGVRDAFDPHHNDGAVK